MAYKKYPEMTSVNGSINAFRTRATMYPMVYSDGRRAVTMDVFDERETGVTIRMTPDEARAMAAALKHYAKVAEKVD